METITETVAQVEKLGRCGGFAAMSPERRREMASMGGKAAQASGRAHRFTAQEAQAAGRRGWGAASRRRRSARQQGEART